MVMRADIDIDVPNRDQILSLIQHVPACQMINGEPRRHNSGIYVTDIPKNPLQNFAAIDHHAAEQRGYFKIDILNQSVYQLIKDQDHYDRMIAATPPWSRLWQDPEWAQQLVHVGSYTNLLCQMKPDSIPRMAAFISVIRPGKAHLQGKTWDQVFASVWDGDISRGYSFKQSHAISYAVLVALHMCLIHLPDQGN